MILLSTRKLGILTEHQSIVRMLIACYRNWYKCNSTRSDFNQYGAITSLKFLEDKLVLMK